MLREMDKEEENSWAGADPSVTEAQPCSGCSLALDGLSGLSLSSDNLAKQAENKKTRQRRRAQYLSEPLGLHHSTRAGCKGHVTPFRKSKKNTDAGSSTEAHTSSLFCCSVKIKDGFSSDLDDWT